MECENAIEMTKTDYHLLVRDAHERIGSFIACGGDNEDIYVKHQIKKIEEWYIAMKSLRAQKLMGSALNPNYYF